MGLLIGVKLLFLITTIPSHIWSWFDPIILGCLDHLACWCAGIAWVEIILWREQCVWNLQGQSCPLVEIFGWSPAYRYPAEKGAATHHKSPNTRSSRLVKWISVPAIAHSPRLHERKYMSNAIQLHSIDSSVFTKKEGLHWDETFDICDLLSFPPSTWSYTKQMKANESPG